MFFWPGGVFKPTIMMSTNVIQNASKVQETSVGCLAQHTSRCEHFLPLPSLEGERIAIFLRGRLVRSAPQPTPVFRESPHSKEKAKEQVTA